MARGSQIVVSGDPCGKWKAGVLGDSSVPGTIMQIKYNTALTANGQFTWVAAAPGLNGKKVVPMVLLGASKDGYLSTTSPGSGTTVWMYAPIAGEEMNVIVGLVAGTANYILIGERLIIDAVGGVLVPEAGSPEDTPFIALETTVGVAADYLCWVLKT